MLWFIFAILSYFLLAIGALFDRYFLAGPLPSSRVYTFNIVILWLFLSLLLVPFGVNLSDFGLILLGLASGLSRVLGILFIAEGIIRSEVSRIVPANGALLSIFSFLLFFIFLRTDYPAFSQIIAFSLLLSGSLLISFKKFNGELLNFKTFKYPVLSALFFALNFFSMKYLFLKTDFLSGFFLIMAGGGICGLLFLLFPGARKEIFTQKRDKKVSGFFLVGQAVGGLGVIAQYYAVFLAKPVQIPLINAVEGVRYVFLFFFVFALSRWSPQLLREEMAGAALWRKAIAILIIGGGLTLLAIRI